MHRHTPLTPLALAGQTVVLHGGQFGAGGQVYFGDLPADASAWSDEEITVLVPEGASGDVPVRVDVDGAPSNALALTVYAADCAPDCFGECGSDGCGGDCGQCDTGLSCDEPTQSCVPDSVH